MPLTRHLYREDETAAALMSSILNGRCVEAAFWTLELLDSGLADELLRSLRTIWLYGFGIGAPQWLVAFQAAEAGEGIEADRMIELVVGLARIGINGGRDGTAIALLGAGPPAPDRVCSSEKAVARELLLPEFAEQALRQGKTKTAWWSLRALPIESAWGILGALAAERGAGAVEFLDALRAEREGDDRLGQFPALAIACASVCLRQEAFAARWSKPLPGLVEEVRTAVERWRSLVGRRARRELSVPIQCLYWLTARGRDISVYDTTEKELMGSLERPGKLWGSGYWDEAAEAVGGWEAVRNDDEAREAFYDREFPDDIPDEWSRADYAKSHGGGVLQRGGKATAAEWARRWFSQLRSAVIWNGVATGLEELKRVDAATAPPGVPAALWEALEPVDAASWNLRPAGRRLVVN
jgi:hypothetical protein